MRFGVGVHNDVMLQQQHPHHFAGGLGVIRGDVLLQGGLGVAHPAAVRTGEGLRLLHRDVVSSIIQVWCQRQPSTLACVENMWWFL